MNKFGTMGWQFYTNILQGVYIPAGKNLRSKRDFRKNSQENFFASLSQETPIYTPLIAPKTQFLHSEGITPGAIKGV